MPTGYITLVLHGHLPYVFHPDREDVLEERWLYEAITECYLPLLEVFDSLVQEHVDFRVTFSLSPTLISMLTDEMLQERYDIHLQKSIQLAGMEVDRLALDSEFKPLAEFYLRKLLRIREKYHYWQRNLIKPFKRLQESGCLEIITTCATHGFIPLMSRLTSLHAQVYTAIELYNSYFGNSPPGIWLPECGYKPGIDQILREYDIGYFFVDTHGIANSRPTPLFHIFAPVCTRSGVAAFGRDPESSRQVWDRHGGYPGDPYYREFYRDIGYDLDLNYIGPFLPGGNIRVDTGMKYYRITGDVPHKEPYQPDLAHEKAAEHAGDFVARREKQLAGAADGMDRPPLALAPYDAELFGHWWYEGPLWLKHLCRRVDKSSLRMITPTEYLLKHPENQVVDIPMCSWGDGGYNQYWLNTSTDWMYKHLHQAEEKMSELADDHAEGGNLERRCLRQCARELLLAQSSDWPFIIHSGTAVEYAVARFKNHLGRFNILADMLEKAAVRENILTDIERRTRFLPQIDPMVYCGRKAVKRPSIARTGFRILMLSWEYPPKTVGGLARHVHDLAYALASMGDEVHVVTCPAEGQELFGLDGEVYVHRVHPDILTAEKFIDWVDQLNRGMFDMSGELMKTFGTFDLVHAHDWLVGAAARDISSKYKLPLVATIHATEHGRNRGLHNELQQRIHDLERDLACRADKIICCSRYMKQEIASLFDQPFEKIKVIPNGVELDNLLSGLEDIALKKNDVRDIVFLGRLVPEKGVQVLISALRMVMESVASVQLIVAGRGPFQYNLEERAYSEGVAGRVKFIGFVNDEDRNRLLRKAAVAVFPSLYEPFGIVALEAMAAGVPVVVSDTGGLRDIIEHGVDGYLSVPGDADMLAYYITELLNNSELSSHFARRARLNVQAKFNWQQIASYTLEVYARVVAA